MSSGIAAAPSANRERLLKLASKLDEKRFEFETARDERAIFAFTYVEITRSLAANIDIFKFQAPEWIVALAEAFAGTVTVQKRQRTVSEPVSAPIRVRRSGVASSPASPPLPSPPACSTLARTAARRRASRGPRRRTRTGPGRGRP